MVAEEDRAKLRAAFSAGTLRIRSVSPGGEVEWRRVRAVLRNEVPDEAIVRVTTPRGASVLTGGHKVYVSPEAKVLAEDLRAGQPVVTVSGDRLLYVPVTEVTSLPARRYMYDLSVEGNENYVIGSKSSELLVKNSPDRNYHFRPPEAEANLGSYNQVFGQIWEDAELLEYLERALDWWNMMPPATEDLRTVDMLVREKSAWRTAILWQAIVHACFALQANWTAEEFSLVGETSVAVYTRGGFRYDLPIEDLYRVIVEGARPRTPGLSGAGASRLRAAYREGSLLTRSVNPDTGQLRYRPVMGVLQHNTPDKELVCVHLSDGTSVTCTVDHSLFLMDDRGAIVAVDAEALRPGSYVVSVLEGLVLGVMVSFVERLPPVAHTYDLSVPGDENFVLTNGILAHNSYSIGGISLDIQRSSSYSSLADSASSQFDKAAEAKARTVRFMRGLSQSKFGVGVRSSFGPILGRGTLSPRNFL